jgi:hypothetical protein
LSLKERSSEEKGKKKNISSVKKNRQIDPLLNSPSEIHKRTLFSTMHVKTSTNIIVAAQKEQKKKKKKRNTRMSASYKPARAAASLIDDHVNELRNHCSTFLAGGKAIETDSSGT